MNPAVEWVRAFALTLAIEEGVVLALTKRDGSAAGGTSQAPNDADALPKRAGLIAFANLATHPAVWFIFPIAIASDTARIVASETWAVVLEALFYMLTMRMSVARAFGVSAIANGASFGIGVIVRMLTGWV